MGNKVKDMDVKSQTYYFFNDIINIKVFWSKYYYNRSKVIQKYSHLLHWICDDKRFEICKN